jgi:hypothetical protein
MPACSAPCPRSTRGGWRGCCRPASCSAAAASARCPACAPAGPACCTSRATSSTRKASAPSSKRMRCRRSTAATSDARKPPRSPAGRWHRAAGGSPRAAGSTRPASAAPYWPGSNAATSFAVERLERDPMAGTYSWRNHHHGDDVVLANGVDAAALVPDFRLPIRSGRGLVSHIPESAPPRAATSSPRGWVT